MNKEVHTYLSRLDLELNKTAGRGEMALKLIGTAYNAVKNTPKSFFSRAHGKMIDLSKPIDKITGTANSLKDMILKDGVKRDTIFTRSLQSDYTRLLRDRLQELSGLTTPALN
jgi:hypothetical protein